MSTYKITINPCIVFEICSYEEFVLCTSKTRQILCFLTQNNFQLVAESFKGRTKIILKLELGCLCPYNLTSHSTFLLHAATPLARTERRMCAT